MDLQWETWRDVKLGRAKSRLDLYLGEMLKKELATRAEITGMSMSELAKEVLLRFVRSTTQDTNPREEG